MNFLTILTAFLAIATLDHQVNALNWSCSQNGTAEPIDLSELNGLWYEIARVPQSDVPACVKVNVPTNAIDDQLNLQLDYVNNINNGWAPTKETLRFPWDSETQNGLMNITYGSGDTKISLNLKYLGAFGNYSLVCGYTSISSGISLLYMLSRQPQVNMTIVNSIIDLIHIKFPTVDLDPSELTWVQQDGKCNGSAQLSTFAGLILFLIFLLRKLL